MATTTVCLFPLAPLYAVPLCLRVLTTELNTTPLLSALLCLYLVMPLRLGTALTVTMTNSYMFAAVTHYVEAPTAPLLSVVAGPTKLPTMPSVPWILPAMVTPEAPKNSNGSLLPNQSRRLTHAENHNYVVLPLPLSTLLHSKSSELTKSLMLLLPVGRQSSAFRNSETRIEPARGSDDKFKTRVG